MHTEKKTLIEQVNFNSDTLNQTNNSLEDLKIKSDNLQERLIREGSSISLNQYKELKEESSRIKQQLQVNRKKLHQHLEFLPFLIANDLFNELKIQIETEQNSASTLLDKKNLDALKNIYKSSLKDIDKGKVESYTKLFLDGLIHKFGNKEKQNIILDYTDEISRKIPSVHNNVQGPLVKEYESIIENEKDLKFRLNQIQKKLRSFESKTSSALSNSYRKEKEEIDNLIESLLLKKGELLTVKEDLSIKNANISKRISELESKQRLVGQDQKKLLLSQKVYDKLSRITEKIKIKKKYSLEKSILVGMNSLMHKADFIEKVSIEILEDYLDINLIDKSGTKIDKESLSKGEQQLYATSILKSLVEESGINFPIFVDSPLQKFDKVHSENIIKKFYPSISKQVVLFPLVEKELTFDEFKLMESNITSIHKIISENGNSRIEKIDNSKQLFE